MSQTIWTRCAERHRPGDLEGRPYRVVEGQHVVSTRKVVDSDTEQGLLEEMIDEVKPSVPNEPAFRGLHYLLTTPFRYPPLRHGSRFGVRHERGLWYGSDALQTAFAETAFYRLYFLEGTSADLAPITVDLSTFRVPVSSSVGLDLTTGCFAEHTEQMSSPLRYVESQQLGKDMREHGVECFRYQSARDPERGTNLGIFTPAVFQANKPSVVETWYCVTARDAVEISRRDVLHRRSPETGGYRFQRNLFEVDGRLPTPVA